MAAYPRDMIGYGETPPHAHWPGEARIAVQFVVNYEEGGENNILHGDAASEAFLSEIVCAQPWPGQRHMNMESIYEYGSRAGFWRLRRLFTERRLPVTVFAVAMALERNPEAAAAMVGAQLKAGESLLVHGGSGGIGVTAIQIAKSQGVKVFATAGSEAKCRACLDLGADAAIQYKEEDFFERIKALTQGNGVNVILDIVGGDYINRNLKSLAVEGRLVTIAFSAGHKADISIAPIMVKRLTWTGSTLRPQSDEAKAAIAASLRKQIWPLIENGTIRPVIYKTFPIQQAAQAHRLMESSEHIGKILLTT